jgi:hypothetical protein
MADLDTRHPGYGWDRNAGYGTAEHRAGLTRLGPCEHHRRSFAPIRAQLTACAPDPAEPGQRQGGCGVTLRPFAPESRFVSQMFVYVLNSYVL